MDVGDTDAQVIAYDDTYGISFPSISGNDGGGNAVHSAYGVGATPTVILIAPDGTIVEQDIFPIPNAQAIITPLESYGIEANSCESATLTAGFSSNTTDLCDSEMVDFSDNSIGDVISWEWTFEGGYPSNSVEENPSILYMDAGVYSVTLTVSDGVETNTITMDDYLVVHNCTAIPEFAKLEMSIHPNPSPGILNLDITQRGSYQIYVYDMMGQLLHQTILSNTNNQLDISHLETGVYIINAHTGTAQIKQRVIIE